jgi:hypothetical protein
MGKRWRKDGARRSGTGEKPPERPSPWNRQLALAAKGKLTSQLGEISRAKYHTSDERSAEV